MNGRIINQNPVTNSTCFCLNTLIIHSLFLEFYRDFEITGKYIERETSVDRVSSLLKISEVTYSTV
jgi:hypothetical protein